MFCSNCGYRNDTSTAAFCQNCGKKLEIPEVKQEIKEEPLNSEPLTTEPPTTEPPTTEPPQPEPPQPQTYEPIIEEPLSTTITPNATPVYTAPPPNELSSVEPKQSEIAGKIISFASKHTLPLAGAGILLLVAIIVIYVTSSGSLPVSRALSNFEADFMKRAETTPLGGVFILAEALEKGSVSVSFDFGSGFMRANGDATLSSDTSRGQMAIEADLSVLSQKVNGGFYMNRNSAAFGSNVIGNDYYGFRYDRFRRDFPAFGRLLGMTSRDMDELSDLVEWFGNSISSAKTTEDTLKPYVRILTRYLRRNEESNKRTDIRIGRETMRVRRVAYVLDQDDIADIIHEILDQYEKDINLSSFPTFIAGDMSRSIRDMRREIDTIRREELELTIAFYIGSRNRLQRIDFFSEVFNGRNIERAGYTLNLGEIWELEFYSTDSSGNRDVYSRIEWEMNETRSGYENIFIFNNDIHIDERQDYYMLESSWNPSNGNFTIEISIDGWRRVRADEPNEYTRMRTRWRTENTFSGNYQKIRNGFVLKLNDRDLDSRQKFDIEITVTTDGSVPSVPKFIDLQDWGNSLLRSIEDAMNILSFL